ncbi:MAG: hypothetical protein C5B49_11095 [Bdellovibrio sp.]|nr:MAG: hypothetical protein C5B49_11095 [Bdellovibrio sp.]
MGNRQLPRHFLLNHDISNHDPSNPEPTDKDAENFWAILADGMQGDPPPILSIRGILEFLANVSVGGEAATGYTSADATGAQVTGTWTRKFEDAFEATRSYLIADIETLINEHTVGDPAELVLRAQEHLERLNADLEANYRGLKAMRAKENKGLPPLKDWIAEAELGQRRNLELKIDLTFTLKLLRQTEAIRTSTVRSVQCTLVNTRGQTRRGLPGDP